MEPLGTRRDVLGTVPLERPLLGYALVTAASVLAAANATVGKIAMDSGELTPLEVSAVRATGGALLLGVAVALLRRHELRPTRRDAAFLPLFGLFGLGLGQFLYFFSIERLHIGVALVLVNLALVLVAIWARLFGEEVVKRRLWLAIALSLGGLALVVHAWEGLAFDAIGIGAALAAAFAYALYVLMAERDVRRGRPAYALLTWGFLFAALFWTVAQPWWSFPYDLVAREVSLAGRLAASAAPVWLLLAFVVPFGTVVPFVLSVSALRYIPATRMILVAVLEPIFGALIAFAWLRETLGPYEVVGGLLVLTGVVLGASARTSRPRARESPVAEARAEEGR